MLEFQIIFQQAFSGETIRIPCDSPQEANNLRQRFYRYRDKIRQDSTNKFSLLVDHLHFELGVRELVITYQNRNEKLLETLHVQRQDTGDDSLNPTKQHITLSQQE